MKKTVLITSGRSPAGLDLVRTFSRFGHRAIVAESLPIHLCQFSRFGKTYRVPSPSQDPVSYIKRIRQIVQQESVDLILPVYEEIFPLAFFRQQLGCPVLADNFDKLKQLHSKFEFIELCRKAGLSHPKTKLISSGAEIDEPANQIIKPEFSRFGTGVVLRPSPEQIETLNFERPLVLQEFAEGQAYCGFCLARKGQVLLQSVYPLEASLSGVCISFRHDPVPEIVDWMNRFVEHFEFTGSIGFDFVLSGNRVLPIECNPRITSGIHLYAGSKDLVAAYLHDEPSSKNERCQSMAGPFVFANALLNWSLWKKWFTSKDVIFEWTDPFPLFGLGLGICHMKLLAWRKRMPMSEVSSLDIDYNGDDFPELKESE